MLYRLLLTALVAGSSHHLPAPAPTAAAVIDSAIARMGGRAALEGIVRIRREMMTQWQRTNFEDRPYADAPSYEMHSDLRDYSIPAWRNTRRFYNGSTWTEIADLVRDSVAIRRIKETWGPLNIAYVDERHELFTVAPERVLLLARAAPDLRLLGDTVIAGLPHSRVGATLDALPSTIFIRKTDGLPALVRFRAAQANDFGLAPWGTMETEVWYGRWGRYPSGVILPSQWDTRRVGRPYKRITVLATVFDTVGTADSFAVSDSLRGTYLATARKPMHDIGLDSAKVVEGRWALFGSFGGPVGAVMLGGAWWALESGQAPLNAERAAGWLAQHGGEPQGVLITAGSPSNGGLAWWVKQKRTVQLAPAMQPFAAVILRNHGQSLAAHPVTRGSWQMFGRDSVWIEPIDYPDFPGAMYLYVPSLKWAYSSVSSGTLQLEYLMRRLKERGFQVERTGSSRNVLTPVPTGVLSSAGNR